MNDVMERLTKQLLEENNQLAAAQARTWIELLWEDFESTYAKVGKYRGQEMTEQVVGKYIQNHGKYLHEIVATNPKYKHLVNSEEYPKH
jgi:WVELL protein